MATEEKTDVEEKKVVKKLPKGMTVNIDKEVEGTIETCYGNWDYFVHITNRGGKLLTVSYRGKDNDFDFIQDIIGDEAEYFVRKVQIDLNSTPETIESEIRSAIEYAIEKIASIIKKARKSEK